VPAHVNLSEVGSQLGFGNTAWGASSGGAGGVRHTFGIGSKRDVTTGLVSPPDSEVGDVDVGNGGVPATHEQIQRALSGSRGDDEVKMESP
jgi:hypothetical protein